ncbi:MAG TPA: hypothetical protein PLU22_00980 [Polyangiaceae bacterium]|nr:hypothetical protein [Polyangiaceae bacterium]
MIPPTEAELVERLRGLRVAPPDGAFEERLWDRLADEPPPVRQLTSARRWTARRTLWTVAAVLVPTGALAGAGIWEASRPAPPPAPAVAAPDGVGVRAAPTAGPARGSTATVEAEPPVDGVVPEATPAPALEREVRPRPGAARAAVPEGSTAAEPVSEPPAAEPVAEPASSAATEAEPPLALGRVRMSVGSSDATGTATTRDPAGGSLRDAAGTRSGDGAGARVGEARANGERAGDAAADAARREREQQRERARTAGEGAEQRRERAGEEPGGPR